MSGNIAGLNTVPTVDEIENPFEGDLFGYEKIADQLTNFVKSVTGGFTIGVDAKWGEGKTYFARHWCAKLREEDIDAVYIDAYANDYIADPFLMLAGEIIRQGRMDNLREKANNAAQKIVGNVAGLAWNVFLEKAIGSESLITLKSIVSGVAESAKTNESELIEKYELATSSLGDFKAKLSEIASKKENPLVVIIDELDRCKPDFAVATLERLKHLFEVDNIVFVLMADWGPLEQVIKSSYGYSDVDLAKRYLGKFVYHKIELGKYDKNLIERGEEEGLYISFLQERLSHLKESKHTKNVVSLLSSYSFKFRLSLREMEQCCVLYSIWSAQENERKIEAVACWIAWVSILKIAKDNIFRSMLSLEKSESDPAHKSAMSLLENKTFSNDYFKILPVLAHKLILGENMSPEENKYWIMSISSGAHISADFLISVARSIDSSMFFPAPQETHG